MKTRTTERVIVRANERGEIVLLFPDITNKGYMTTWNASTGEHAEGLPSEFRTPSGLGQRGESIAAVQRYSTRYKTNLVQVVA